MPLFIAVLNNDAWPKATKYIVSVILSVVVGLLAAWFLGVSDPVDTIKNVLIATQLAYGLFWKPTGIEGKINSAFYSKE
jgi:hypothetical protein